MIDKESIEQLKQRVDIVDLISGYLELKKSGANFKALCPFHQEDTPSFVISPSKQIFHCFGCGVGGDAIKFLMEYEKLTYPEAVEKLASMYNFTLKYSGNDGSRKKYSGILSQLNLFYKKMLDKTAHAKEYLTKRGVSSSSIERFEIGYAPSSKESIEFLKTKMVPLPAAIEAGVAVKGENGVYARFIERITFPIYSPSGELVGFGGRTISSHPAKYINSPQSAIFNKSRLLYGYNLARESIFKKGEIIVTEGYLDVIMLHQAGFSNSVATLGTALTKEHLPLLKRGNPKILLAYDADRAGIDAAFKASLLLSRSLAEGGVVLFPEGKDPADMVKNGEIVELNRLFSKPKPFVRFVLEKIASSFDLSDPLQKQKALKETQSFLNTLPQILKEEYKHLAAALLSVNTAMIRLSGDFAASARFNKTKDTKELTIIKSLLERPELIDTVLDYIDSGFFQYHKEEFELLLSGKKDHPKLMEIAVDEEIKSYSEEDLKAELLVFLIKYYERKTRELVRAPIPFEKKSFLIRKYKDYINRLKRGELVFNE